MKPKVKEHVAEAFAGVALYIGFSIHGWPSLCFLIGGSFCGSVALYFWLLNNRTHGVDGAQSRNYSLLLFAVTFLGVIAYWREFKQLNFGPGPEPPKPHLELGFLVADERGWPLMLTNDVFKLKYPPDAKLSFSASDSNEVIDFKGVVVVPVPIMSSNVMAAFAVNAADGEVDDVILRIIIVNPGISYTLNSGWREDLAAVSSVGPVYGCEIPRSIPGRASSTPPIIVSTHGPVTTSILIWAIAPKMDTAVWGVQLHFKETASPLKPFTAILESKTNADGKVSVKIDFGTHLNTPKKP